jgi:mannosyl-oligosaccharide alpha-1,3-glucosidase
MSYSKLTAYTQLQQEFTICPSPVSLELRDDSDVVDIAKKFDKHKIPSNVIWLDTEYTHEKQYFTFDPDNIGVFDLMTKHLDKNGR